MRIDGAKVILIWENGKQTELGTFEITADDIAESKQSARIRWFRQRLGLELVRKGFWIMFPWRKWKCD
jgi:hypothetical protein